ncbi:MAG: hypothetical protein NTZ61_13605 [Proteobacteria bacterium]|nr:hypothetical protein [Pseudomonadota bacterium]
MTRPVPTALLAIAVLLATSPALAQPGAGAAPDAVEFALAWARGGYASPVICRFKEEVQRGLRRIVIGPGPRSSAQRVDRIQFFDIGATGASRCHDDLGAEEPNVVGTLLVSYTAKRPRSDTPQRDIEQELKTGPLSFEIASGRLRIGAATGLPESLPEVDFAGGKLRIGEVAAGSDDARRLGDFASQRRLRLDAEAPDGTRIGMLLAEFERR